MMSRILWLAAISFLFCTAFAGAQTTQPATTEQAPMRLPKGVKALHDLAYTANAVANQHLDLYLPEIAPAQPMPVIVFFHGGAWHKGTKDRPSAQVKYVPRGYAVASVEYRFSQEAPFPAQIFDSKAAVRWLRAHATEYHLDPNRFAAWGTSAGGHLAALLGTSANVKSLEGDLGNAEQSSAVQAVVDCYGPADLAGPGAVGNSSLTQFLGGPVEEKHDLAVQGSPITYVAKSNPPFLILHGDNDKVVSHDQSVRFAAALQSAGVEVTFKTLLGAGHGTEEFKAPEIQTLISDFLDKHLHPATGG